MLSEAATLAAPFFGLKTKSADGPKSPVAKPLETKSQTARRYRPRRTTSDRVRDAVLALAEGRADLLNHEESAWSSITFSGTRHQLLLDFNGAEEVLAGEEFVANLPEHEFKIPGQLVADATIGEVEHRFGSDERMVVKAVLLLLEDK